MNKIELSIVTEKRECGECQVCCELFGIPELNKPNWQKCQHQCDKGCGIYPDRPKRCRDFECGWLTGVFGQGVEHRPDKSGVIFTFVELPGVGEVPTCIELRPGAADEYWVGKAIKKRSKKRPFAIMDVNKKIRTEGKALAVAAFKQQVESAFNE